MTEAVVSHDDQVRLLNSSVRNRNWESSKICDTTNAGHGYALAASRDTAASSNVTECLRTSR